VRSDAIGVADGVGGWEGVEGADPALFSKTLMHYACTEFDRYDNVDDDLFLQYDNVDPTEVLRVSFGNTMDLVKASESGNCGGIRGSTTALLAVLRNDELRVANLGDCGLTVIRRGAMLFRTEEQQHSFNYPFQLGTGTSDSPDDAQSFNLRLQRGDIIIVGSDGVFDNLFDEDILDEVLRNLPSGLNKADPQLISDALARRAKSVSEESRYATSPFQSRAVQEGFYYQGGKVDDISVIVAVVTDLEDSPDRR
ncbi:protein serine/threonine phosphatase 2C, partial [Ramicandelaber brevisporus]